MKKSHLIAWHARDANAVLKSFKVTIEKGLSSKRAAHLLEKNGLNEIPKGVEFSYPFAILRQFLNPLAIILILAAIATVFLKEYIDAGVVLIALIINVTIGVTQEGKAAHIFSSLEKAQDTETTVIRDGKKHNIPTNRLVAGDIVILESGFAVPADIRVIEQKDLRINEATLTGEWAPVEKTSKKTAEEIPISDRANMLWKGTVIVSGSAVGVVVATGRDAKIGDIAEINYNDLLYNRVNWRDIKNPEAGGAEIYTHEIAESKVSKVISEAKKKVT